MIIKPLGPKLIFDTEFYDQEVYNSLQITQSRDQNNYLTPKQISTLKLLEVFLNPNEIKYMRKQNMDFCNVTKHAIANSLSSGVVFCIIISKFLQDLQFILNPKTEKERKINFNCVSSFLESQNISTSEVSIENFDVIMDLAQQLLQKVQKIQVQTAITSQVQTKVNQTLICKNQQKVDKFTPNWVIKKINDTNIENKLEFINQNNDIFQKVEFFNTRYNSSMNFLENTAQNGTIYVKILQSSGYNISIEKPQTIANCKNNIQGVLNLLIKLGIKKVPNLEQILKHDLFSVILLLYIVIGISTNFGLIQPPSYKKIIDFIKCLEIEINNIDQIIPLMQNGVIIRQFLKRMFIFQNIDIHLPKSDRMLRTKSQCLNYLQKLKAIAADGNIIILQNVADICDNNLIIIKKELEHYIEIYTLNNGIILDFQSISPNFIKYGGIQPIYLIDNLYLNQQFLNLEILYPNIQLQKITQNDQQLQQ
uniref:Calponin homology (CH) domain-containing protein n=1 Tax=Spironucleus salmonicida TaxID=348837 RepID=V6LT18_9EUKA|eukprot:EST47720.1 Hypothetical protein SS50377_12118 [Spironucleus salmonicida]